MAANKKSVAIVGMGRFGKTLYRLLSEDFHIVAWDNNSLVRKTLRLTRGDKIALSKEDVFACDVIFYTVPISAFEKTLRTHKAHLHSNHLLIDTLSVKLYPAGIIKRILGKSGPRAMLTHPMFGPDSSRDGFRGLPIVMDRYTSREDEYRFWKRFFRKKGLKIVELGPRDHDRLAAGSQGVVHFIGRLLEEFGFHPTPIDTLGAKKLHELQGQVCRDTWELFLNLQNYNPYTSDMRERLGDAYDWLSGKLLSRYTKRGIKR
jgi:prephenate dehydrogenase